jgi:hypothetical protein
VLAELAELAGLEFVPGLNALETIATRAKKANYEILATTNTGDSATAVHSY